jgi:hypothetical protein
MLSAVEKETLGVDTHLSATFETIVMVCIFFSFALINLFAFIWTDIRGQWISCEVKQSVEDIKKNIVTM